MDNPESPADEYKTNCGMKWRGEPKIEEECTHLDCAIWACEEGRRRYLQISLFVVGFGIICGLGGLLFSRNFIGFGLLEIAIGLFIGIFSLNYHYKYQQLIEFKDHGTIHGVKGDQIS